jgi:hypothetical protein
MSMSLRSDPELTALVERARARAETSGELRAVPWSMSASPLSQEARKILASWVSDGGYRLAVAAIAADDVDLADQ